MALCVTEALANVARHADTGYARLTGQADGDGASVTVTDDGAGFDVAAVPTHRRGLRESIAGRMRAVGGSAEVRSETGSGTRIVLRWPDD
jgi:signal transduction histidine kinase